jgi:Arc/MetJ-type ribon-helix-helix transcriptional regulator
MTMLSFRIDDAQAARAQEWAERLGVDRSELLRDAVRRHLDALAAQQEAESWEDDPDHERAVAAFGAIADWGPDEDWSDWHDAAG